VADSSGSLTRNWKLKLSAIGLAILIWFSVRVEAPSRQEISGIPIRVDLVDPDWALVEPPFPATLQVRVGGPSRELIRMAVDRPPLTIPLDQVISGDTVVTLRSSWIRLQDRAGLVVESMEPATVRLTLERIERLSIPVLPRVVGELPPGLALSAPPRAVPAEVRVTGPRSRLQALTAVPLVPVSLAQIQRSGPQSAAVDLDALEGLQTQPTLVDVEFLVEDRVERVVSGIPIVLSDRFQGEGEEEMTPSTGVVRLSGARSLLDRVDPTLLRLVADGEFIEPGEEAPFPLRIEGLPALVEGIAEPAEARVRVLPSPVEGGGGS
jgi:YbbR domain-containing protein